MTVTTDGSELKAGWKNEVEVKSLSKQEVAKHNTKKDLWIIIHGSVYDVTEYCKDHPGGADALIEVGGQDATSAYEDVGHSEDAGEIMHAYLVGVLEGAQSTSTDGALQSAAATTQVVRRQPESKPATDSSNLASTAKSHCVEIAACAVSAAGLAYLTNHLMHTHGSNISLPGLQGQSTAAGNFTRGFLTACTAISIAGFASMQYFQRASNFGSGFSGYAARIDSATPASAKFRPSGVLSPSEYQQLKLRTKEEVAKGIYRFIFDLPSNYSILGLPIGQHVAIRGQVGDHTVVRSYTPVSNNRDLGRLELIIRVYPDGQLGNYLKSLKLGDTADIRGPKGAMRYRKGLCKSIGMVGGGTGITPLFQLIRAICEDPTDITTVSVVYGNRTESDIMLKEKMDAFAKQCPEKFKIWYTLDQPGPGWQGGKGYVSKELLGERMPKPEEGVKILLCGPPGMVNATKKNLVELGFESPGAVSKMSDQVFCF